ncbi:MAG: glycosyl hydrolase [Myxococcales bacterium]|nr:glycosyl hydrolase [Myxococcales bacterium]
MKAEPPAESAGSSSGSLRQWPIFKLSAPFLLLVTMIVFSSVELSCDRTKVVYFYEPDLPFYDPGDAPGNGGYSGYYGPNDQVLPPTDVSPDLVIVPDLAIEFDFGFEDFSLPNDSGEDTLATPDLEQDVQVEVEIPVDPVVKSCETVVRYQPTGPATNVVIAGEFNGWSPTSHPLTKQADGSFRIALTVAAGEYGYKLVVDGQWLLDPANPYTKYVWDSGSSQYVENSNLRVVDCKTPGWKVLSAKANASGSLSAVIQFVRANGVADNELDTASLVVTRAGTVITPSVDDKAESITIQLEGLAKGKHSLRVEAMDKGGRKTPRLFVPLWVESEAFDWRDGLMYFVFTDRFYNGDPSNDAPQADVPELSNYQGGDFAGVIAKLKEGYFTKLGVRSIWLSPVYDNPEDKGYLGSYGKQYTGFHGYWPEAPRSVEEHFGTPDKLKEMVKAAHDQGIRVIFDLVLNHTHSNHPYYKEHQNTSWFNGTPDTCVCGRNGCDWNAYAETCWFDTYTPDLNYREHEVVKQMTEDTLWWVREFDVDGLRLDAVKHMPDVISRTISLRIRDEMEVFGPRFYLVGETFAGGSEHSLIKRYLGPYQLDGQYDFTLLWPIIGTFAYDGNFFDLDNAVNKSASEYGDALMSPFLGNHDISRFINEACNGLAECHQAGKLWSDVKQQAWDGPPQAPNIELPYKKMALGLLFVFTQPGVPLLYYGDEIGLPGAGDPDNRRKMRFGDGELSGFEKTMLATVQAIGKARADTLALRRGGRATLLIESNVYAYTRFLGPGNAAIVVLNRDTNSHDVTVNIPGALALDGKTLRDKLSGASVTISNNQLKIQGLAGWTGMILVPDAP